MFRHGETLPEFLDLLTKFSVSIYIRFISMKLTGGLTDKNNLLKKLSSMICGLLMSPSVIIL